MKTYWVNVLREEGIEELSYIKFFGYSSRAKDNMDCQLRLEKTLANLGGIITETAVRQLHIH